MNHTVEQGRDACTTESDKLVGLDGLSAVCSVTESDKQQVTEFFKGMRAEQVMSNNETSSKLEKKTPPRSDGSPVLKSVKRNLAISPSTPLGLPRKLVFRELNQEISQISFGEDIEMLDLEKYNTRDELGDETKKSYGGDNNNGVGLRRIVKPRRGEGVINRTPRPETNVVTGSEATGSFWDIGGQIDSLNKLAIQNQDSPKPSMKVATGNSNYKGISVMSFIRRNRKVSTSSRSNRRRKKGNEDSDNDKERRSNTRNQCLIYDYFNTIPEDKPKVIAGDETESCLLYTSDAADE